MTITDIELKGILNELPSHLSERVRLLPGRNSGWRGMRVLYWTHHSLRSDENPALDVAVLLADRLGLPLLVYQGLSEKYRFASDRHHTFILEAARDLQVSYSELGISFVLHVERRNSRSLQLARLASSSAVVVTEDFPLETTKQWTDRIARSTPVVVVDTACIVPMRLVGKAYERAFAFRDATEALRSSRVDRPWPTTSMPVMSEEKPPFESLQLADHSLAAIVSECDIDHSIGPVSDTRGGWVAGYARWQAFRKSGLPCYAKYRNQIEVDGVSRMSAYLHYGMVSPFRIAREASADRAEKFLDELLVWRELAYSFCFYRTDLDFEKSVPNWARATLLKHSRDPRSVKSWETLARARSGSRLWDAAQRSLIKHGELHNNVRMTWGKAILEWSQDPQQSLERLVDLNHRYALDGRDPASYGGILWCLGQFDRPFFPEQPIFGSVRTRPIQMHEHRTDLAAYEKRVDRRLADPARRIAIIGAGVGGLMCSRILQDHGLNVTLFDKAQRPGGRTSTRQHDDRFQFDHGAQYVTFRDPHLKRYLESWIFDQHVALWSGKLVSIDDAGHYKESASLDRYVGTPRMESLAHHLARELRIQFDTTVRRVIQKDRSYRLLGIDDQMLGEFDIVLWNCPPMQTKQQIETRCTWKDHLSEVEMQPCWAVMLATKCRWNLPFDGAFINQGGLSWIARDCSKPGRPSALDTWVLHSTVDWAKAHLETPQEQVSSMLISEAESVTQSVIPDRLFVRAHRWLYSRPAEALPKSFLWDEEHWLGACGDWCGGPRVEGALKSGVALAGRVLGAINEDQIMKSPTIAPIQLSLFDGLER